jgi:GTP cyclohydrolase I
MQERFTNEVRARLEKALETDADIGKPYKTNQRGICVLVEGWHGCMSMRGVKSAASTITMAVSGEFEDDKKLDRFLALTGRR